MNWIPTSERLPEALPGASILVHIEGDHASYLASPYRILDWSERDGAWLTFGGNKHDPARYSHWMQLTPPAAQGEGDHG